MVIVLVSQQIMRNGSSSMPAVMIRRPNNGLLTSSEPVEFPIRCGDLLGIFINRKSPDGNTWTSNIPSQLKPGQYVSENLLRTILGGFNTH